MAKDGPYSLTITYPRAPGYYAKNEDGQTISRAYFRKQQQYFDPINDAWQST